MAERLINLQVMSIQSKKVGEQHATGKNKWADDYWRENVYGNSAYTLKSWNRGEGWELAPSGKYYRAGLPKNGGLVFRIISDPQERLNLLKSGHAARRLRRAGQGRGGDPRRRATGRRKLVSIQSPWSFGLTFNNSQEPFKDKRVRQALSLRGPLRRDHQQRHARPRAAGQEHGAARHADARPQRVEVRHEPADRPSSCSRRRATRTASRAASTS